MRIKKSTQCGTVLEERESRAPKQFDFENMVSENQTRNLEEL